MKTQVRTRFAPSPTGYMHIGNLRTALYAFLFAKKNQGQFLLRIEDTDQARQVSDAVDVIYKSLRVTGLNWDEGPDLGGEFGPYVQSQRKEIYKEQAQVLLESGHAYRCFCSKEVIGKEAELAKEQIDNEDVLEPAVIAKASAFKGYDGRCRSLTNVEINSKLNEGQSFVIRQKIDKEGSTSYFDHVYGEIKIENTMLDDQVLLKSDGFPTYNFANVVDDHLMQISHIIRGCEYLSSTPKYIQLYKAFGWTPPEHIHLPHILGESGKKLSKRDGSVSLGDFIEAGYLPEAIINYIALLGWNPGTEQEIFSLKELTEVFGLDHIHKSPATFSTAKLNWLNSQYIKKLDPKVFSEMALVYVSEDVKKNKWIQNILVAMHSRVDRISDVKKQSEFLTSICSYSKELYVHKKMKTTLESSLTALRMVLPVLENLSEIDWHNDPLFAAMSGVANGLGVKAAAVLWPVRVALSGLESTPGGASELAQWLGKDESISRIKSAIGYLSEK